MLGKAPYTPYLPKPTSLNGATLALHITLLMNELPDNAHLPLSAPTNLFI